MTHYLSTIKSLDKNPILELCAWPLDWQFYEVDFSFLDVLIEVWKDELTQTSR